MAISNNSFMVLQLLWGDQIQSNPNKNNKHDKAQRFDHHMVFKEWLRYHFSF